MSNPTNPVNPNQNPNPQQPNPNDPNQNRQGSSSPTPAEGAAQQGEGAANPPSGSGSNVNDSDWQAAVTAWVDDYVRNSPIAGNTEAWNHLNAALPHLKEYLSKGPPTRG
jgi:hypothetical protein